MTDKKEMLFISVLMNVKVRLKSLAYQILLFGRGSHKYKSLSVCVKPVKELLCIV